MKNQSGIFALWRGWVISSGSLALVIMLGLWIPKLWLPFVAIGLQMAIHGVIRSKHEYNEPNCYIIPHVATLVLFWSAMVMFIINYMVSKGYIHYFSSNINPQNPYITVLVVAPVEMAVAIWGLTRKSIPFCRECRRQYGEPAERGYIGLLYAQESKYQLRVMLVLSAMLSVVSWTYYFVFYINININTPDRFFFIWVPVIYTLGTFVYMWMRYTAVYASYSQNISNENSVTKVRFLIFSGDTMLLGSATRDDGELNPAKFDTPVTVTLPHREYIPEHEAIALFGQTTDIPVSKVRFMYAVKPSGSSSNLFNFIVTLEDRLTIENTSLGNCGWYTIREIKRMMENHSLDSRLSAAIVRLVDVVTAWKTYDLSGRRLYKIKNYRPSFNLGDIETFDVDYSNPIWLDIKDCNQDKRFWRIRRFWKQFLTRFM